MAKKAPTEKFKPGDMVTVDIGGHHPPRAAIIISFASYGGGYYYQFDPVPTNGSSTGGWTCDTFAELRA